MSDCDWESVDIIDDMAEPECLRALLVSEIARIADNTGRNFVPDEAFEDAVSRCARRYRRVLELQDPQNITDHEGAIAAARAMYRILHEEYLDPRFEAAADKPVRNAFADRLMTISSRGLVAHSLCYRLLVLIGWYHFEMEQTDHDNFSDPEFNALVESIVRNFEANVNYAFEQMLTRAFHRRRPFQSSR